MHSIFILALVSVTWVLVGFTLAFGPDVNGWGIIGGLDYIGLKGVGTDPGPYAKTIPASAFMAFQMMFAIITPALITGAFAERKRFKAFVLFTILWSVLVYSPIAHWVWGQGAGCSSWAPSTSPAAPSSTSAPAWRPSSPPSCWGRESGASPTASSPTTSA